MTDAIRTPEELFADLPDFPYAPRFTPFEGFRLAHLDEGAGAPVVFLQASPRGRFHDWGGPIGLRVAVEQPERISRLVVLDTGLFTGRQRMTDAWNAFRDFVARTEDLPVGMLVRRACHRDPGDAVIAGAGHFLQEDAGAEIGGLIADWLRSAA